jgi:hypothetical protein
MYSPSQFLSTFIFVLKLRDIARIIELKSLTLILTHLPFVLPGFPFAQIILQCVITMCKKLKLKYIVDILIILESGRNKVISRPQHTAQKEKLIYSLTLY